MEKDRPGLEELMTIAAGERARRMFESGRLDEGVVACGQAVGLMNKILPAGEIVKRVVEEAARVRDELGGAKGGRTGS